MASTAVQILTLSPCRKMMVFSMDLDIESDIEADVAKAVDEDGGKRLLLEPDDDQERGHVKKRRKQSKPVRIASSESLEDGECYRENLTPGVQKHDVKCSDEVDSSFNKISSENIVNDIEKEYAMEASDDNKDDFELSSSQEDNFRNNDNNFLLPINLSNAKNSTIFLDNSVRAQVSDSSSNYNLGKTQTTQDITTSPYQEPCYEGIQYKKDNVFVSSSSSPLSFPSVKSVHASNNAPHSGSPIRIFNPEAFCDLCNKEFCNKYFLKTHKANKHGIYLDNIGPNVIDALPSLPFINYFSNVNEVLPSSPQMSRTVAVRKPQLTVSLPQQNAVCLPQQNAPSLKIFGNGNTRAFCNICQREFCNKYFVRRHKAKIHGIIDTTFPDTPPDGQEQKSQNESDVKLCAADQEKNEENDIPFTLSLPKNVTGVNPNTEAEKEEDCKEYSYLNINKDYISNTDHQITSIRQERETDSDESTNQGVIAGTNNPSSTHSTVSPLQCPSDMCREAESCERLKTMGIINSEAFCNICCKEYCNKYFLRTHKMKSHGIIPSDCERRDERSNGNENSSLFSNQVMPLNLIVGDHSPEKMDKVCSDSENSEIFCSFCGQKFRNSFLLKMHVSCIHPQELLEKRLPIPKDSLKNDEKGVHSKQIFKLDSSTVSENSQKSYGDDEKCSDFEFQNSHSVILKCEICHKGFDPVSLEVHLENEHANLLEEICVIGEEENSNSRLPVLGTKIQCNSCQKPFQSMTSLDEHIIECHSSTSELIIVNNSLNTKFIKDSEELLKTNQTQATYSTAEIQTPPTSSFCEICKKELCNKYFMKTHMQRMHGISIENGAHIGGVVCDICNKELCSKYFLRVHKQNSHGIVEEILGFDMSRNQSPNTDSSLKPSEQNDLNNRYFSHFTEVCAICSRRFRSMKWLKAHLLNDHGDEGKEKWKEFQNHFELKQSENFPKEMLKTSESVVIGNPLLSSSSSRDVNDFPTKNNAEGYTQRLEISSSSSSCQVNRNTEQLKNSVFTTIFNGKNSSAKQYQCSYCTFSTSILAFLFVHERSHISGPTLLLEPEKKLQCKICSLTFENDENFDKHVLSHNLSGTGNLLANSHSVNQSENLSQTESDYVNDKNVLKTQNRLKDDSCFLNESESLLLRTNDKYTKEKGVLDFTKSIGIERTKNDCQEDQRKEEEIGKTPGKSDIGISPRLPASDNLRTGSSSDETLRRDSEQQVDDEINDALIQVKESLKLIANKTEIPVSFSVPQTQQSVIMQPFVLEDSGEFISHKTKKSDFNKSFLSSIVFLPVKERLKHPVMVSFKLTPT